MRDKLKQYQKRIETQLEKERDLAKILIKNGNKKYSDEWLVINWDHWKRLRLIEQNNLSKALVLLKKKKYLEKSLENTDGQLDNLEQMVHSIEFKQVEIQVINGLKIGNDCLKNLNQILSLDNIEQLMDDTKEAVDMQNVFLVVFILTAWLKI
jgi:charged multivesicular body protein 6